MKMMKKDFKSTWEINIETFLKKKEREYGKNRYYNMSEEKSKD